MTKSAFGIADTTAGLGFETASFRSMLVVTAQLRHWMTIIGVLSIPAIGLSELWVLFKEYTQPVKAFGAEDYGVCCVAGDARAFGCSLTFFAHCIEQKVRSHDRV